ncbi:MAG: hypothetical protein ACK5ML_13220, partial [Lachnospiraceae bacterium]
EELGRIMGELEFAEIELESMILNGKNDKANRCLRESIAEIKHALSDVSDALFEVSTSPYDGDDFA